MTDSKGFTLLEVMISIAIFAVAAYLISDFNQIYSNDNYSMRRACEAHAADIISAVQQETYYLQIINPTWTNSTSGPQISAIGSKFTTTPAVSTTSYYLTGNTNYDRTVLNIAGADSQYDGHLLIQGSLRSLAGIFNHDGDVQCKLGNYAPLTNGTTIPMPGVLANLPTTPTIKMELTPYRLTDHSPICSGSIYPAPRGKGASSAEYNGLAAGSGAYTSTAGLYDQPNNYNKPQISTDETYKTMTGGYPTYNSNLPIAIQHPSANNVNNNIGIGMTVQISYTMKGKNYSCSATQDFQYPEDDSAPPSPNVAKVVHGTNSSIIGGNNQLRDYCLNTANSSTVSAGASAQLQMGYDGTNSTFENGVELFCKDLSWIRRPASTTYCKDGGTNITGQPIDLSNPKLFAQDGYQFPYNHSLTVQFGQRFGHWQPCQNLTQCGVDPTLQTNSVATGTRKLLFTNYYQGLPYGCVMNFEVVAIDTAGNRSDSRSSSTKAYLTRLNPVLNPSLTYGDKNFKARDNEIYFPTCGGGEGAYYNYYRSGLGYYCPKYGYYNCTRWCSG